MLEKLEAFLRVIFSSILLRAILSGAQQLIRAIIHSASVTTGGIGAGLALLPSTPINPSDDEPVQFS